MLGGLGLMALVVSSQRDSLAWTSAGTAAVVPTPIAISTSTPTPLPTSVPPPADPLAASKASSSSVIELAPVRITASRSKAKPDKKPEAAAVEACSEWREVGPIYVDQGEPRGARRVRDLC